VGQPLCNYRLILPFDDGKFVNVGSNIDFSQVDGEVKIPIASNVLTKTTFAVSFSAWKTLFPDFTWVSFMFIFLFGVFLLPLLISCFTTPYMPSQLQPESNQVTSEVEYVSETSTSTFQVVKSADTIYSFSLMQCVCPWITLGGLGSFSQKASDLSFSYGGIISHNEHQVFFQWDKEVSSSFRFSCMMYVCYAVLDDCCLFAFCVMYLLSLINSS
jgi:hypothetical protein